MLAKPHYSAISSLVVCSRRAPYLRTARGLKAGNMLLLPHSVFHSELHFKKSNHERQDYLL